MVSIGIYISKKSVCFAELSLEGTKPSLSVVDEYFFKNQASQEEKDHFILSHFEKIKHKYKGQTLRFCYGLSQNVVTSFSIHFPFKEKFKILKTLPFEVETQSPFSPDKSFFDTRICKIQDQQKSQTICFVTPEDNVKDFLKWESQFKTNPYLLSCEGAALANLLELWNKPLSQPQNSMSHSVYLYLGEQNSQILFYQEGYLAQVFILDWSTADIIKKMEDTYKLTAKQAWEEFFSKSFILTEVKGFTKEQVLFSNIIKTQLQLLVPKLKLFKISFETNQKIPLEEIVVFGPGSVIKNLTAFLTAELSIKTSRLKNLPEYPHLGGNNKPASLVAFGLALEGLKSSPYKGLNFLQSLQKKELSLFPKQGVKLAITALVCFVILTAYTILRKRESFKVLNKAKTVFLNYGTKITRLKKNQIDHSSIHSFLNKNKNITDNEQTVKSKLNKPNPMDHLQLITQKISDAEKGNLNIHYLKLTGQAVEIKGSVNQSFLPNLKSQLTSLAKENLSEDLKGHKAATKQKELKNSTSETKKSTLTAGADNISPGSKHEQKVSSSLEDEEHSQQQENPSFFSYSFTLKEKL